MVLDDKKFLMHLIPKSSGNGDIKSYKQFSLTYYRRVRDKAESEVKAYSLKMVINTVTLLRLLQKGQY